MSRDREASLVHYPLHEPTHIYILALHIAGKTSIPRNSEFITSSHMTARSPCDTR